MGSGGSIAESTKRKGSISSLPKAESHNSVSALAGRATATTHIRYSSALLTGWRALKLACAAIPRLHYLLFPGVFCVVTACGMTLDRGHTSQY